MEKIKNMSFVSQTEKTYKGKTIKNWTIIDVKYRLS